MLLAKNQVWGWLYASTNMKIKFSGYYKNLLKIPLLKYVFLKINTAEDRIKWEKRYVLVF
jgi:hypothetical protein